MLYTFRLIWLLTQDSPLHALVLLVGSVSFECVDVEVETKLQLLLVEVFTDVTFFISTTGGDEDEFGSFQHVFDDGLVSGLGGDEMIVVIVGCKVDVGTWGTVKLGSELSP